MQTIVVTDQPDSWDFLKETVTIVEASGYLADDLWHQDKSLRVINLCESYNYQSIGYYVSLLAHARNHKAIPSVHSIQDVLSTSLSKQISEDIHDEIQQSLKLLAADSGAIRATYLKLLALYSLFFSSVIFP